MKHFKSLVILGLAGGLLGCTSTEQRLQENPNAFLTKWEDGVATGTYNPAGWTTEEVRSGTISRCPDPSKATYSETEVDGLRTFEASCGEA